MLFRSGKDTFSFNLIRAQMGLYEGAIQQMDKVEELHRKHLSDIENMIDSIRKVLMSRAWYIQALGITDETRKEWTTLSLQEQDELLARCSVHLNWKIPCLVINAFNHEVLQMASTSYQLYIADQDDAVLADSLNKFSVAAKNTMRTYNIKSFHDMDLSTLPQKQFGMVIVWQIMERLTLPYIRIVLDEIKKVLQPGGTVMFNVNDCDTVMGSQLATNPVSKSYVTKALLEPIINETGFALKLWTPLNSHSALVEIQLPGEVDSFKDQPGRGMVQRYTT